MSYHKQVDNQLLIDALYSWPLQIAHLAIFKYVIHFLCNTAHEEFNASCV